jgi:hypothetical protein
MTLPQKATQMSLEDRKIILAYANDDLTLKNEAIKIHRKWIPFIGTRGTPEQDFMAEVDNPTPDFSLRALYRSRLRATQRTNE